MIDSQTKNFPNLLRRMREKANLPQKEVASLLGIDSSTYCKIEKGKYIPNKSQVEHLAQILGTDRDQLVKAWLADKIIVLAASDKSVTKEAMELANKVLNI
jgi:transcriptional regulator with XRE-family HTH domain